MTNRDALRATAHNGCVQPVRGEYGAIPYTSRKKPHKTTRTRDLFLAIVLLSGVVAVCLLVAGVFARPGG